ncbi:MAG: hypothetical protein AB1611_09260 [bacterium]
MKTKITESFLARYLQNYLYSEVLPSEYVHIDPISLSFILLDPVIQIQNIYLELSIGPLDKVVSYYRGEQRLIGIKISRSDGGSLVITQATAKVFYQDRRSYIDEQFADIGE